MFNSSYLVYCSVYHFKGSNYFLLPPVANGEGSLSVSR